MTWKKPNIRYKITANKMRFIMVINNDLVLPVGAAKNKYAANNTSKTTPTDGIAIIMRNPFLCCKIYSYSSSIIKKTIRQ